MVAIPPAAFVSTAVFCRTFATSSHLLLSVILMTDQVRFMGVTPLVKVRVRENESPRFTSILSIFIVLSVKK